jgi:hypothetical protein
MRTNNKELRNPKVQKRYAFMINVNYT